MRDDLVGKAVPTPPAMLDYKTHVDAESMYNTPPTYAIYIAGLVFQWLKRNGGIAAMEQKNIEKANLLYDYLDTTDFYRNPVAKSDRSRMNVPFTLKDAALDEEFLKGAKARGMVQLKGHRSVGGMRASIYNAMPIEGVTGAGRVHEGIRGDARGEIMADQFQVLILNNISAHGLKRLPAERFVTGKEIAKPDAILVRSADMHSMDIAEVRAGHRPRRFRHQQHSGQGDVASAACRCSTRRAPTPTPSRNWCWPAC